MQDFAYIFFPPLFDDLNNDIWQGVITQLIYGSYLAVRMWTMR
jgi:hypothetical protein